MHPGPNNPVVDFEQARSCPLSPARRIVFGIMLCFLAALFAVETKVAWVANAGTSPSDLTAAKLCPVAGKIIESKLHPAHNSAHFPSFPVSMAAIQIAFQSTASQWDHRLNDLGDVYRCAEFLIAGSSSNRPPPSLV